MRLLEAEGRLEQPLDEPRRGRQLPDTVREVIAQRLRRLTPDCRRLLDAASTLGREFGIKELAAVAEIDEETALESIDEAITARVIAEAPTVGRLRFWHALVRDTLYEGLTAGRRRAAHLRAAEILERLYASNPEPHLAELAHHFFEALPSGDAARAVDYAQRAGDHAVALLAYEEAARLYALALRGLDMQAGEVAEKRCLLLVALGDARARAGDEPAAREAFLEAATIASDADLPVPQAQAALGYGGRLVWSRAYDDIHLIPLLESALQALPAKASALRVRVMARLAGALRDHPSRDRRASLSAQAVGIARRLGDPATLAYALDGRYSALLWPETAEQRLAIADEIVTLAEQVDDNERTAAGRLYRVIANMELGRIIQAERELDIIAEQATTLRQPAQLWMATASRANLALFQGRFDQAQTLIDEALTLGERAQRRDAVLSHRLQLFLLDRETDSSAEIESLTDQRRRLHVPDATGVSMRAGVHPRPAWRRESSPGRDRRPGSTRLRGGSARQRIPVLARFRSRRRRHAGRRRDRGGALRPPGSIRTTQRDQRRRSRNRLRVENSRGPGRRAVAVGRRSSAF